MYKNLKDLFKAKYSTNNQEKSYGGITDRSIINSSRQIPRYLNHLKQVEAPPQESGKKNSSYQTYIDLKHRLQSNIKNPQLSRPPSITNNNKLSPFSKKESIKENLSMLIDSNQCQTNLVSNRKQSVDAAPLLDVKIINHQEILRCNNQEQIFKAFSRGNSRENKQIAFNIGLIHEPSSRGFLKDKTNNSNFNSISLTPTLTPKNLSRPTSREQKTHKENQQSSKRTLQHKCKDPTSIKYFELEEQYSKIKNQIFIVTQKLELPYPKRDQKNSEKPKLQSFLKNYNYANPIPNPRPSTSTYKDTNARILQDSIVMQNISQNTQELQSLGNKVVRRQESIFVEDSFSNDIVSKQHFYFHFVIGKGGFGKVWKVESKKDRKYYAMKEMSKSKIIAKRSVASVMNEKNLLSQLKHNFIVNMTSAFQDRDNLYLIMDLMTGGDLRYHIGKQRRFKEHQTRFFAACIVLSLEYLHNKNIIHRDLKPENLVLDSKGYAYLTDLGIARVLRADNSNDTSGTPGYMAPEVMCRQNHGIAVDYFALGVIVYEFMIGRRPYQGRSRNEIRDQMLAKQAQIKQSEIPSDYSQDAADFANKLLQRKAVNRLGFNGPDEVKSHPWLKDFPWQALNKKELQSPYIPISIDTNVEYRQQISLDQIDSNEEIIKQNNLLLRRDSVQNLFQGYDNGNMIEQKF